MADTLLTVLEERLSGWGNLYPYYMYQNYNAGNSTNNDAISLLHQGDFGLNTGKNPLALAFQGGMFNLARNLLKPENTPEEHRAKHVKALVRYLRGDFLTLLAEWPPDKPEIKEIYEEFWSLYREKAEWLLENGTSLGLSEQELFDLKKFGGNKESIAAAVANHRLEQVIWQAEHGAPIYGGNEGGRYQDNLLHLAIKSQAPKIALWAIEHDAKTNPPTSMLDQRSGHSLISRATNRSFIPSVQQKTRDSAEYPLEMAANCQQWDVVQGILDSTANCQQKYWGVDTLFEIIYRTKQRAEEYRYDDKAQEDFRRLCDAYPAMKASLLRDANIWAKDNTLNGRSGNSLPGAFYWMVAIGDKDFIDLGLEKGASPVLGKERPSPIYTAFQRLDIPLTNYDQQLIKNSDGTPQNYSRQDIFYRLHQAVLENPPPEGTYGIEPRKVLGQIMIESARQGRLDPVPDYLNIGVSERSVFDTEYFKREKKKGSLDGHEANHRNPRDPRTVNPTKDLGILDETTLLHVLIQAKHEANGSDEQFSDLLETVIAKSQARNDGYWHTMFMNSEALPEKPHWRNRYPSERIQSVHLAADLNPPDLKSLVILLEGGADLTLSNTQLTKVEDSLESDGSYHQTLIRLLDPNKQRG